MTTNSLDEAIRASFRAREDENAGLIEDSVNRVWERIEVGSKKGSRSARRTGRRRMWLSIAVTAACLIVLAAVKASDFRLGGQRYYPPGVPMATSADYAEAARASSRQMSLPAPTRPVPGFSASADPSPASVGQTVEIHSTDAWTGENLWLYWAPASEQYIVAYLRKLPRDAMLIGSVGVSEADRAWGLSWKVPGRLERDGIVFDLTGESVGYLVAIDDEGHLAYQGLQLGPKRTITIAPQPAVAGETVTISGADYPPNTRVRIDVLHESPDGGTDLQTNLGWVTTSAAGTFDFAYRLPERWNWPFADHTGTMQDHWLTVGAAGAYHILTVEQGEDGPRAATYKRVEIRRQP